MVPLAGPASQSQMERRRSEALGVCRTLGTSRYVVTGRLGRECLADDGADEKLVEWGQPA